MGPAFDTPSDADVQVVLPGAFFVVVVAALNISTVVTVCYFYTMCHAHPTPPTHLAYHVWKGFWPPVDSAPALSAETYKINIVAGAKGASSRGRAGMVL